jgi:predicted Rossmann fold nucleotide-binding protein DprA/Smf involved in DNA uptake
MKISFALFTAVAALTASAFAEAPTPVTDMHKVLSAAAKDQKMAFILMGRPTCGNCNATKAMIRDGKIPVTSADYVMADLNCDDEKVQADFMRKYGKEKFGETLPFVVVTDAHGKALASSGGMKGASEWTTLLTEAKNKAGAKTAATAGTGAAEGNWPFKTPAAK